MNESKLVGGVLVLTVEAFAAGQGHSDSGNHDTRHAIVRHHYHASKWPDKHPRFKHAVFGEVEECNWNPECVRKWDEDTAEFAKLSPEDQTKQIALFETKEKEKEEEAKRKEEQAKKKEEAKKKKEEAKKKQEEAKKTEEAEQDEETKEGE